METDLLWLFLFIALSIGWYLGYSAKSSKTNDSKAYQAPKDIKHRLQLFFDSYADESLDRFIHSLEVSYQTFDLHISIGKQFRTQGEVEKAILIHQNLMAHPELPGKASEVIIYELAKDYLAAGLFDRAESLLLQLNNSKQFGNKSQKRLLDLYEHEKDWESAIKQGLRIDCKKTPEVAKRVSQYYCELAGEKLQENLMLEAVVYYKQALSMYKVCIRALLGLAKLDIIKQEFTSALYSLKQVAELSPENITLILPELLVCTKETDTYVQHQKYLQNLLQETGQVPVMLAIVESMIHEGKKQAAITFLVEKIKQAPSIAAIDLMLSQIDISDKDKGKIFSIIPAVFAKLKSEQTRYKCGQCGFSLLQLHWMCPSCKSWQTIKPVVEYEQSM